MYIAGDVSLVGSSKSFIKRSLIILFWLIGLLSGLYFALKMNAFSFPMMRSLTDKRLSIFALYLMLIFPFLVSAVLIRFMKPLLILPLVFLKAFLYCSCVYYFMLAYGDAAWLVKWLLLFSDSFVAIALLWFCLRNISDVKTTYKADLLKCCGLTALVVGIDYYIVSPFSVVLY